MTVYWCEECACGLASHGQAEAHTNEGHTVKEITYKAVRNDMIYQQYKDKEK